MFSRYQSKSKHPKKDKSMVYAAVAIAVVAILLACIGLAMHMRKEAQYRPLISYVETHWVVLGERDKDWQIVTDEDLRRKFSRIAGKEVGMPLSPYFPRKRSIGVGPYHSKIYGLEIYYLEDENGNMSFESGDEAAVGCSIARKYSFPKTQAAAVNLLRKLGITDPIAHCLGINKDEFGNKAWQFDLPSRKAVYAIRSDRMPEDGLSLLIYPHNDTDIKVH